MTTLKAPPVKMETIRACSIWRALEVVGDVSVMLILERAFLGCHSFESFVEETGVTRSVVSDRLKKLVMANCLTKASKPENRRAQYHLTQKGRDLFPVALAMVRWQHKWEPEQRSFHVQLTHSCCNSPVEPLPVCTSCLDEIDPREVDWQEGPGLVQVSPHYSRRRRPSASITERRDKGALVDTMITLFGDRWSTLIVRAMFSGFHKFDQIQQDTMMAPNILSGRIEDLTARGILKTRQYCEYPLRHEYRLTKKGRDLYPVILGLLQWGDRYYADEKGSPLLLSHRPCGSSLKMQMSCNHCGEDLVLSDMRFEQF